MITETREFFERVSHSKKQAEDSISLFEKKISKELVQMEEAHEKKVRAGVKLVEPYQHQYEIQHEKVASSFAHLKTIAADDHKMQRLKLANDLSDQDARRKFMLTIDGYLRITGAPYDLEWTNGAIGYANKSNGEFGIAPMNGYAAAAIGNYITPTQNMIARLTAYMPITFSWFEWIIGGGYVSTHGGVGVLVYDVTDGSIVADNRAQLWNVSKSDPGLVSQPETETSLGFTSAAETYFVMKGGHQYLAWLWCWGGTHNSGNTALAMANIACKLPFFVLKPWLSI